MGKYNKKYTYKQAISIIRNNTNYQMSLPDWKKEYHIRVYIRPDLFSIIYDTMRKLNPNLPENWMNLDFDNQVYLTKFSNLLEYELGIQGGSTKILFLHNSLLKNNKCSCIEFSPSIEESKRKDWIITKI